MRRRISLTTVWLGALALASAPPVAVYLHHSSHAAAAAAPAGDLVVNVPGAHEPTADDETGWRRPAHPAVTRVPAPTGKAAAARPALQVVGLGDSVPSGYLNDTPSYVTRTATILAAHGQRAATVSNLAFAGARSADTLAQVEGDEETRATLRTAGLVIVQTGANDFDEESGTDDACRAPWSCFSEELATMKANVAAIVSQVHALAPSTQVVLVGYWNVWADGSVGESRGETFVTSSRNLTASVNTLLRQVSVAYHAVFVDTHSAMDQTGNRDELLLPDGNHPDAAGHAAIAQSVAYAVEHHRPSTTP